MIEYIVPSNIDDRILKRAARKLEEGALAALPTDTNWSIVCSFKSQEGVKKLRQLSGEKDERRFTLLCSSISQFSELCSIDNTRFRLIRRLCPGPYVFILKTHPGTAKILDIRRHEAGVRIPNHPVPVRLIETLQIPLYSITAKKNMTGTGPDGFFDAQPDSEIPPIPEEELFECGWELDDIGSLDIILDSGEEKERLYSTILDMTGDEVKLLRKGAGPWPV